MLRISPSLTRFEPLPLRLISLPALRSVLQGWIDEIPPAQQQMRYGNTSYRTWWGYCAAPHHTTSRPTALQRLLSPVHIQTPEPVPPTGSHA